jgi:uncharacterized surface protein with fasciclin (FAS1) repeats
MKCTYTLRLRNLQMRVGIVAVLVTTPAPSKNQIGIDMKLIAFALSTLLCAAPFAFAEHHMASEHAKHETSAGSIVDIAVGNPDFSTLVTALKSAGLVETLSGAGPFTVFAPTNAAFAKLPAGTVESLLKSENKAKLTAILTYHVIAGQVLAKDVVKLTSATTVQGGAVKIDTAKGVMVNDATVTATDIQGSNGVIHVIDTVLMPPMK